MIKDILLIHLKIMKLGWKPEWKFEDALTETINWYRRKSIPFFTRFKVMSI
jgi:nucleoside-diphosphate-sugar epimerase